MFNFFKSKCMFCGDHTGDLLSASKHFAYSAIIIDYHEDCWRRVICNPEDYGHRLVDIALEVDEIVSTNKQKEEEKRKVRQSRLNKTREKVKCEDKT